MFASAFDAAKLIHVISVDAVDVQTPDDELAVLESVLEHCARLCSELAPSTNSDKSTTMPSQPPACSGFAVIWENCAGGPTCRIISEVAGQLSQEPDACPANVRVCAS